MEKIFVELDKTHIDFILNSATHLAFSESSIYSLIENETFEEYFNLHYKISQKKKNELVALIQKVRVFDKDTHQIVKGVPSDLLQNVEIKVPPESRPSFTNLC